MTLRNLKIQNNSLQRTIEILDAFISSINELIKMYAANRNSWLYPSNYFSRSPNSYLLFEALIPLLNHIYACLSVGVNIKNDSFPLFSEFITHFELTPNSNFLTQLDEIKKIIDSENLKNILWSAEYNKLSLNFDKFSTAIKESFLKSPSGFSKNQRFFDNNNNNNFESSQNLSDGTSFLYVCSDLNILGCEGVNGISNFVPKARFIFQLISDNAFEEKKEARLEGRGHIFESNLPLSDFKKRLDQLIIIKKPNFTVINLVLTEQLMKHFKAIHQMNAASFAVKYNLDEHVFNVTERLEMNPQVDKNRP